MSQVTAVGAGVALTYSSSFAAEVLSVEWSGISRAAVDTTFSTSTWMTFIPSAFYDPGELTVELNLDPDDSPPITAVAETITLTFPVQGCTGATWAASGFMTDFSASIPIDDKMTASMTLKLTSTITFSDAT